MHPIALRALTADERPALERLAHSRTSPARSVERAHIIWAAHQGRRSGGSPSPVASILRRCGAG